MRIDSTGRVADAGTLGPMIGYLRGTVRGDVIDVGGVGYAVTCPTALTEGEAVELFVRTAVRETSITLYGFASPLERDVFDALGKATGVGPVMALNLVALGIPALATAFTNSDAKALATAKGVGATRATRILAEVTLPDAALAHAGEPATARPLADPLAAGLTAMGFHPAAVTQALAQARGTHPDDADNALALTALRTLRTAPAAS